MTRPSDHNAEEQPWGELERKTRAWLAITPDNPSTTSNERGAFRDAANPSAVLELIEAARSVGAITEDMVSAGAAVIHRSPLIDSPKLTPHAWTGLVRNVLEAALSRTQAPNPVAEDGWIEWHGGENPVPGKMVDYRIDDDAEYGTEQSDNLDWSEALDVHGDAIIAYRPVAEGEG